MIFWRQAGCIVALLALGVGVTEVLAESPRDKRHRQIKAKLKETSDLVYNYFAPSIHIRYHHPEPKQTYLAYYNEIRVERKRLFRAAG